MRRLLVLAAGVLLATGPAAGAATIAVDTTADAITADGHCSLREAIVAANTDNSPNSGAGECPRGDGADTITLGPGSFEFTRAGAGEDLAATGDLDITGPTTITGAGALLTTIDAKQLDRVIDVLNGGSLTLSGVTVTGGKAPDGASGASSGASGSAGSDGGGIRNQGTLTLTDCVVTGNHSGNGGAGALANGSDGSNGTSLGGTGGLGQAGGGGAGGAGGGLWNSGSMTLTRVVVSSNATGSGGAGGTGSGGQGGAALGSAGVGGNGGDGYGGNGAFGGAGGGVFTDAGSLTIDTSTIANNTTGHGGNGGLGQGGGGGPTLATSVGGAGGMGGTGKGGNGGVGGFGAGIYDYTTTTVFTRSLLTGNTAGAGGNGGTGNGTGGGGLPVTSSSAHAGDGGAGFGGNGGSGGDGGAIFTTSGPIANVTAVANTTGAGGNGGPSKGGDGGGSDTAGQGGDGGTGRGGPGGHPGGGGAMSAAGDTTLLHTTLTGNLTGLRGTAGTGTAGAGLNGGSTGGAIDGADGFPGDGGAIFVYMGMKVTLTNSIESLNGGPACSGTVNDGGHDIFSGEGACPGTRTDPKLGPLADNGGPTQTREPLAGSPAIDLVPSVGAGCTPTDQRGAARPGGSACDAGAYEVAPPAATITVAGATSAGTVNPNARASIYHFEFGPTGAYGSSTPDTALPAGVDPVAVSADLGALAPGTTYHVRLVATNADGSSASADATFTTNPQGAGATKDTSAPVILSASVKPKTFRRRHGTTFRYRLSEAARVKFTLQRHKGRHWVRAKRFTKLSKAGANRKKLVTRKLKPGRYRATLVATDTAGNHSKAKRLTFRIKR